MKLYWKGLRFGLLLQFAVGPVCLMTFSTAQNAGLGPALTFVSAVALVDALYIVLAASGASRLLERRGMKTALKTASALVLILFGLNIVLGVFGVSVIPGLGVKTGARGFFLQGLLMTLSNPLTIVFWCGVLTAELSEKKYGRRELAAFSAGLVSATVFFLTGIALMGTVASGFLPPRAADALNLIVGAAVVFFGVRLVIR